jgi:hypothetical protein
MDGGGRFDQHQAVERPSVGGKNSPTTSLRGAQRRRNPDKA